MLFRSGVCSDCARSLDFPAPSVEIATAPEYEDSGVPEFTTYQLSLHRNYVSHWGVMEAVRELIQNNLDHLKEGEEMDYEFIGLNLELRSHGASLDPAHLLLGNSSKSEDDKKIGSFGEGFKLALLVLTRLGHEVVIHNGERMWIPEFAYSELYGCEVLQINETRVEQMDDILQFEIRGLSEVQQTEIESLCLPMQEVYRQEIIKSKHGEILLGEHQKGKLYIGGLFVCNTEMWHGYNFNPDRMAVERDRQTVNGMDLKFATKEMWFAKNWDSLLVKLRQVEKDGKEYNIMLLDGTVNGKPVKGN